MQTATSWYHLGLRGRLFMAFGVVAALTVLASGSAMISYDSLGRSIGAVAEKSLPEITRASEVVRAAGEVAAAAPRLLAATDKAEREHAVKILTAARQDLKQAIGALAADDAAQLNKTADRILVNLDRLMQSAAERQAIADSQHALVAGLRKSHQKLAEKLSPMADDAGFTLTLGLQTAADNKDLAVVQKTLAALADNELVSLQAILDLRAESNLILGILVEAADLPSARVAAAGQGPVHRDGGPPRKGRCRLQGCRDLEARRRAGQDRQGSRQRLRTQAEGTGCREDRRQCGGRKPRARPGVRKGSREPANAQRGFGDISGP